MAVVRCSSCGGNHESDPADAYLDFRGYRLVAPFRCMCCGRETCIRQFAYGRTCGLCDTGACQTWNRMFKPEYAHPHPEWWVDARHTAEEAMTKYAEVVGASKSPLSRTER